MAVTIGYVGATGRDIGFGGTQRRTRSININQIDPARRAADVPARQRLGSRRAARVDAESVLRDRGGRRARHGPTIQRGQLLRPFPQFGDIIKHETTAGAKRQYHAAIVHARQADGCRAGGAAGSAIRSAARRTISSASPISTRGAHATPQNNYDLDAEYGTSIYDSPHRIILAPIFDFPRPRIRAASPTCWPVAGTRPPSSSS